MTTTAAKAAEQAAEAMRALNYATLPHEGYPGLEGPADVYEVIASLREAHQREQQALRHLRQWLQAAHDGGRVAHDSGGDAAGDVAQVRNWLGAAETTAGQLERVLNLAQNACAHLKAQED